MKKFLTNTLIATSLFTTPVSADNCKSIHQIDENGKIISGKVCGTTDKIKGIISTITNLGCNKGYSYIKTNQKFVKQFSYVGLDGTYSYFGKNGSKACFSDSADTSSK